MLLDIRCCMLYDIYSMLCVGTCVTGGEIFVAGGSVRKLGRMNGRQVAVPESVTSDVWTLNVNEQSFEQRTSMSRARCQFPLVVVDG